MTPLPFGQPGAVVATALPDDISLHDIRLALAGEPTLAFASLRGQRYSNIPYTGLSDELLNWLGRFGTTPGRRYGERHFLRIVPFLRDGWTSTPWHAGQQPDRGISNVIVARPEHLRAEGLLALLDATAAADACLWLLHGSRIDTDTEAVLRSHAQHTDWGTWWDQWGQQVDLNRTPCAAVDSRWWRPDGAGLQTLLPDETRPSGTLPCPAHDHWLGCLRASLAYAVSTVDLHEHDARQLVLESIRLAGGRRWQYHDLARDTFGPAREALEDLCRTLDLSPDLVLDLPVKALSSNADMITLAETAHVVPRDIRAPLLRQRQLTLLARGTHSSPLLSIWGETARIWGTRPRPPSETASKHR